jgi:hypothetical protein
MAGYLDASTRFNPTIAGSQPPVHLRMLQNRLS